MIRTLLFILAVFAGAYLSISSDEGKDGAWANAPGDNGYCSTCHTGTGAGGIFLSGAPSTYQPGQTYNMTLTLNQANAAVGGFQIVATNGATNAQIGTFTPATGQRLNDINRLVQSTPKAFSGGSVSWPVTWTAPATGAPKKIIFYYAGNAANGDGSNGAGDIAFAGVSSQIPLPIELIEFNARSLPQRACLISWRTAAQKNLRRIDLTRSSDGIHFQSIYSIESPPDKNGETTYQYLDTHTESPVCFYRLRSEDWEGSVAYSKVISVRNEQPASRVTVYPNPLPENENLYFRLPDFKTTGTLRFLITGMDGRKIMEGHLPAGLSSIPTAGQIPPGQYSLTLLQSKEIVGFARFSVL